MTNETKDAVELAKAALVNETAHTCSDMHTLSGALLSVVDERDRYREALVDVRSELRHDESDRSIAWCLGRLDSALESKE